MMITPEEFKELYDKVQADGDLEKPEVKSLVEAIIELDKQAVLLQNALVLAYDNTRVMVEALADSILQRTGRTDKKIKRAVAKIAAGALARYEIALQMFLSGALGDDPEENAQLVEDQFAIISEAATVEENAEEAE
jgi:hypothetical protein